MSEEFLLALYPRPFKGIISYLSPSDTLTQAEFDRSQLSQMYWMYSKDKLPKHKGKKRRDPDCLFKIFGVYSGDCEITVHEQMLKWVTDNFNKFSHCSWIALHMNKYNSLSAWMTAMRNPTIPGDEITLYALARLYNRHCIVYTRSAIWSTIAMSKPMTPAELSKACDVQLVYLGKGVYGTN